MTPFSWHRYQPAKGRRYPLPAKLPLIGRQRRVIRWFNQIDAIIILSEHSMGILGEAGITQPRYHVIPLPVKVPPITVERDQNLVLYVGGKWAHKGWRVWQEIVQLLHAKSPHLICEALHGATRGRTLLEIARAGCLVVPEQWHNMGPMAIAEAQLLGTPVVASGLGGIPEMGVTCVPPDRPDLFASAIYMILQRVFAGEVVAQEVRDRYNPGIVRTKPMEAYRSCTPC